MYKSPQEKIIGRTRPGFPFVFKRIIIIILHKRNMKRGHEHLYFQEG